MSTDRNLEDIKSLRDATRAGAGIYFDFASNQAKRGRTWQKNAPEEIRRELCRDCDEEELRTCRDATGIDKIQSAPEGSKPTVLIIMGPSGAGKSTALPRAASMFDIDLSQFAHIDGDDMRGAHRAWKTYVEEDTVNGYLDAYDIYITNAANKSLKKKYSKECLRAKKNCVFPWTSIEQAALDLIEEMGYNVYVLGLLISCAESDCRQQNRAETNGRWAGTPQNKWEVTMKDLATMCQATKSQKVLVFESTDVMNMRLVHSRGVPGIDDPADFEGTVEKLKADMFLLRETSAVGSIMKSFEKLDPLKTGRINRDYFSELMKQVGFDDSQLQGVLNSVVRSNDNDIYFQEFLRWVFVGEMPPQKPAVESNVQIGSSVIARLRGQQQYMYGTVEKLDPLTLKNAIGEMVTDDALSWVALAKDDGWLEPHGLDWQQPGSNIIMKLLKNNEWVSAKVSAAHTPVPIKGDTINLLLDGIDGLPEVKVQEEVALLFTPHRDCQLEFSGLKPMRGGKLIDHIGSAFVIEPDPKLQRQRWVLKSRGDGQYPMRGVWVHPQLKQGGLNEFVRRACARLESAGSVAPEIVMLLGPPAAGKSSISRLPPEQVPEDLRTTTASLQFREEVNNDNLTDCMPGFAQEFREALDLPDAPVTRGIASHAYRQQLRMEALAKSEPALKTAKKLSKEGTVAWAMQWLVYLLYHHGPVRDSLAWDVISVTIVDAKELPVYYSSVMAGKSIGRTFQILELAHSATSPVPHTPLRFVGFWPYASQEARYSRQKRRHDAEKAEKKLKGGNVDSNLVDLNYHAQQAESNITKMMASLNRGVKPTDDGAGASTQTTEIKGDHFLIIDNDGATPKVLLNFASHDESSSNDVSLAAKEIFKIIKGIPTWHSFCNYLFRIVSFFLRDDPMLAEAGDRAEGNPVPTEPEEVLSMITEVDEEVFLRLNRDATADESDRYRKEGEAGDLTPRGEARLNAINDLIASDLKTHLSFLRKHTCVGVMREIRDEDEDSSDSDSSEDAG